MFIHLYEVKMVTHHQFLREKYSRWTFLITIVNDAVIDGSCGSWCEASILSQKVRWATKGPNLENGSKHCWEHKRFFTMFTVFLGHFNAAKLSQRVELCEGTLCDENVRENEHRIPITWWQGCWAKKRHGRNRYVFILLVLGIVYLDVTKTFIGYGYRSAETTGRRVGGTTMKPRS